MGVVASVLVTAASAAGWLEVTQSRTLDFLMRLRGDQFVTDVVVVAIDDAAFNAFGQRQPLPRDYLAKVVRGLQRADAAVVGLDVTFAAATAPAEDAALARAVAEFSDGGLSRVVLTAPDTPRAGPLADPAFLAAVVRGSPEMPEDGDGLIRRAALLIPGGDAGRHGPALALAVAARLGGMSQNALERVLADADGTVPLPRLIGGRLEPAGAPVAVRPGELVRINFVGRARSFLTIPSAAVAALGEPGAEVASDNPLRGRPVLVGATFAEAREEVFTPHGPLAGVEVHANLLHMLLARSFIRPAEWGWSLALQVLVVLAAGVVLVVRKPVAATAASVTALVLVGLPASYLVFQRASYWVDFALPIVATSLTGFGADRLERRRLRAAFSRYVSKEVAAQVLAEAPGLRGERRDVSILFSDLRGFTTLSETMAPDAVAARLNEYFEAMSAAIFRHRGMINDFIGDAIMAIFGAPLADREHALHAARAALAMDEALHQLNVRWKEDGLPLLRMGIGIHTGEVFAGNIGGRARVKYTIVGDAVNVASRVEGLNKDLGTTILVTEATRAVLGARAEARDRGARDVKGRRELVRVFELIGLAGDGAGRPEETTA